MLLAARNEISATSCGARRMAKSAKLLVDDVLQGYPVRKWVPSLPIPLRLLLARYPKEVSKVMQIIHRDMDKTFLELPINEDDSLLQLQASSVNYRIAVGKDAGIKVFSLQTLPAKDSENYGQLAKIAGFSLHAGFFANTQQKDKLERLCRYIARPAISENRLSLTTTGNVRYELKTPYRNGTIHVFFLPIDLISKLAALVPPPKLNLTRFFGVFDLNANVRAEVTASQRGKNRSRLAEHLKASDKPYHAHSMSWAQRLKRVFNIDITQCEACEKFNVKIFACKTDPVVIYRILMHLDKLDSPITANTCRAPPIFKPVQTSVIDDYTIQRDFDFGA